MTEQRLLAAIALFRELYDNNKNIYDVLAEFIRTAILLNSKWSFNSIECMQFLEATFGFEIPEAVVKSCLKNRLISSRELVLGNGIYTVTESFDKTRNINNEFGLLQGEYLEITQKLVSYVNHLSGVTLGEIEAQKLIAEFNGYLLGEKISKQNEAYCSYFIIEYQTDAQFQSKINRIEEGLVLYVGIKNATDVSSSTVWQDDLTIFLDTEHLFSATGLNGPLHKRIFDDFNKIVKEINSAGKKPKKITLRYFDEAKKEVDSFFASSEHYVENHKLPSSIKTAMVSITNGCKSKSDVIHKKAKFFDDLRRLQIEEEIRCDYYANPKFNLESTTTIAKLRERFNGKHGQENTYSDILKIFTKINCLRKGDNSIGLERVAAILMTEHRGYKNSRHEHQFGWLQNSKREVR